MQLYALTADLIRCIRSCPKVIAVHRIEQLFLRGALALGLIAIGIAGGFGYDPARADEDAHCRATPKHMALQASVETRTYPMVSVVDESSRNTDQAACKRGKA